MTQYEQGKQRARATAQEIQIKTAQTSQSYQQIIFNIRKLQKLGKRYGLLEEFKREGLI